MSIKTSNILFIKKIININLYIEKNPKFKNNDVYLIQN